jgi:hypothetical protein
MVASDVALFRTRTSKHTLGIIDGGCVGVFHRSGLRA